MCVHTCRACVHMYACLSVCVCVCAHACVYVREHVCVCTRAARVCICMHV